MKLTTTGTIAFFLLIFIIVSCQSEGGLEFDRYYSGGSLLYQSRCQNCHGANGEGLAALIPPLTDSVYLRTNKAGLACFTKNGLKGKITVAGRSFEGQMPYTDMAPIEIAKVLTYVTNSFGNKMGVLTTQQVAEDLKKCE
ncbi:hypothetical protein BH09BAC6_BH09BAC6_18970 [soil metagenome]|jgi:mono/diheme cytochrome c family protein